MSALLERFNDVQYTLLQRIRDRGAFAVAAREGTAPDFSHFHGKRQALIVTFKRSGEPIPTVVNFGLDSEGRLYFRSEQRVPKIRRIETDPHVRVCPCNFRGKPTGPVAEGRARVLAGDEKKRAYDAQRSKPFLVVASERDTNRAGRQLSAARTGPFHEIGRVTTILSFEQLRS